MLGMKLGIDFLTKEKGGGIFFQPPDIIDGSGGWI